MIGLVIFWLVIAIVAIAIDVLTSNFCFMLFATGSIVAAICATLGVPLITQVLVFAIVNIIVLAVGYPWLKKKFKTPRDIAPLMEETYIGRVMKSENLIEDKAQIKVNGEYWTVINEGDPIYKGEKFIITGIEGIKLKIKKIQED